MTFVPCRDGSHPFFVFGSGGNYDLVLKVNFTAAAIMVSLPASAEDAM